MMTGLRLCRWTGIGRFQVTPKDPASQEARSEAERRRWFAAASAAVERRQASALRSARDRMPGSLRRLRKLVCVMRTEGYASVGVSPPDFIFRSFVAHERRNAIRATCASTIEPKPVPPPVQA